MTRAGGSWRKVAAVAVALGTSILLLQPGCDALRSARPNPLGDQTYQIACPKSLPQCLTALDAVCPDGYTVVRADEKRERRGPPPWVVETYSSEAIVHCLQRTGLFSGAPEAPMAAPALVPPATPARPSAATGCFPGTTQACVGRGGCAGGQVCAGDGHAFGPCDCGTGIDGGASDASRD